MWTSLDIMFLNILLYIIFLICLLVYELLHMAISTQKQKTAAAALLIFQTCNAIISAAGQQLSKYLIYVS